MTITKDRSAEQYRYIAIFLVAASLLLTVTIYKTALIRTIEAFRDFGLSVAYYILNLFGMSYLITPTVGELSSVDFTAAIPITWDGFKESFVAYFKAFFDLKNFVGFFDYSYTAIYMIVFVILIAVILVAMAKNALRSYLSNQNNDVGKISKPLSVWLKVENRVFRPFGASLGEFKEYFSERKIFKILLGVIWAVNLNVVAIAAEALAYLLYLFSSFDFLSTYLQVYKLAIDITLTFRALPFIVWAYIALKAIGKWRENVGYDRLVHFELRNCGFIKTLPIAVMIVGTMGSRKTTLMTDMVISQEIMYRGDALQLLYINSMKFPHFPWQRFEYDILTGKELGILPNLDYCNKFVRKLKKDFKKEPFPQNLYGYDFEKYGLSYYDNLQTVSIFDVLSNYAREFFIYIEKSSLTIANYSIREDNVIRSKGNFPLWDLDIFRRTEEERQVLSQYSHILDFDAMRPGKRKKPRGKVFGSLEFGVCAITEIGKERGNKIETEDKKKTEETANQKNDLTNLWIKMSRHIGATIDNHCFFKLFMDEQRVQSLNADARELCSIINIDDGGEFENVMPCFLFGEMLNDLVFSKFERLYEEYRYNRADDTLFMYLLRSVVSKFLKHYRRIHNTFDVAEMTLSIENEIYKYFLSRNKAHSGRFSTDCFSDFFAVQAAKTGKGLEDFPVYQTVKASTEELKLQNSYFIDDITNIGKTKRKKAAKEPQSRRSNRR